MKNNFNTSPLEANYDDWWNGNVTFIYATRVSIEGELPRLVKWSDFKDSDAERIRKKQKEIFNEQVQLRLNTHIAHFTKTYESSKLKEKYFNDEIRQCRFILFDAVATQGNIRLKHWGVVYHSEYIRDIQNYIESAIYHGVDDGFDFIHSPNCKFQDNSTIHSSIYARSLWEYYEWLKSLPKKNINIGDASSKKNKEALWFKVGVCFAKGEIDKLKQEKISYTEMAGRLGNPSFRPFISESMSNGKKSNKNIFSRSKADVQSILSYCERNNIKVVDSFLEEWKKGQKLQY
jgi:hypothetical protein